MTTTRVRQAVATRRPWGRCPQAPGFKAPTGEHREVPT